MPGGILIGYPFGRSVDRDGRIQLDSRGGVGGVAPDVRVPRTLENVLAFAAGYRRGAAPRPGLSEREGRPRREVRGGVSLQDTNRTMVTP